MSPAGEPLRYELHEQRLFDRPVLVIALEGWVDAGLGASTAIGSGGNYALAAARALMPMQLDAEEIVRRSMKIAADICVYTNGELTVETV